MISGQQILSYEQQFFLSHSRCKSVASDSGNHISYNGAVTPHRIGTDFQLFQIQPFLSQVCDGNFLTFRIKLSSPTQPPKTHDELLREAENERQCLLDSANGLIMNW